MRGFQAILAAALIAMQPFALTKPPRSAFAQERPGDAAYLDRSALDCARAALIASLWPEARPCVIAAVFAAAPAELSAPLTRKPRVILAQARFSAVAAVPGPRLALAA